MRILHVSHQYRPAIGGSENYIADLSEQLALRGHTVDVFTSRSVDYHTWRNTLPAAEQLNGVNVSRFTSLERRFYTWWILERGLRNHRRRPAFLFQPAVFFGNGPVCPALWAQVLRRAHDYDLIHINNLHYAHAYTAFDAARRRNIPIVVTPHVHAEQPETHEVGYMRHMLAESNLVLAVTAAESAYIRDRGLSQRTVVAGNGLALDRFPARERAQARQRFGLPADAFVILFLGRKVAYKGLAICLQAFAQLRQADSNVRLLAVGPETDDSQILWRTYGDMEGLVVRGAVADEERLDALAAADILTVPSTGEAFGIIYLEGWAYRIPVIGAAIRSVSSLISHGEDGFVVPPYSTDDLVACWRCMAADPERRRSMGERGYRKVVARYTVERIAAIVEGAYQRLLRHTKVESTCA